MELVADAVEMWGFGRMDLPKADLIPESMPDVVLVVQTAPLEAPQLLVGFLAPCGPLSARWLVTIKQPFSNVSSFRSRHLPSFTDGKCTSATRRTLTLLLFLV